MIVSAMLSRWGASNRLLRLVGTPAFRINISVSLALEYESSLTRVTKPGTEAAVETLLSYLIKNSSTRRIYFRWRPLLPDPGDHMVLEVAVESRADYIVTFNRADFGPAERFGIGVVTPGEFLAILEKDDSDRQCPS